MMKTRGVATVKVMLKNPDEKEGHQIGCWIDIGDRLDFSKPLKEQPLYQNIITMLFDSLRQAGHVGEYNNN